MKIRRSLSFCIGLSMAFSLAGQSPGLLKAEGEIPLEFIMPSTAKYKQELENIRNEKDLKKKESREEQFALESNFAVDDILRSGLVLFNDPATIYVNEVLHQLPFENERSSRTAPRAYVLNSAAVNAFATDQGIIFVTMGMLANLENEAQLAFVLSHELMHFKYRHSMNKFVQFEHINRESRQRERTAGQVSVDGATFEQSMYSRTLEEEADDKGLALFLQSRYDPKVVPNVFRILHYAYLPFANAEFARSFFEDENFVFPSDLWLSEVNAVSPMEDEQDSEKNSSHPSSASRLKKVEGMIPAAGQAEKTAFLLPESRFFMIRDKARYQLPFFHLYAENFPESIYTAYLLLQKHPDDPELKKVVGKALYMQAKYRAAGEQEADEEWQETVEKSADEAEGAIHRVYHLLSRMDAVESITLAIRYNWALYRAQPEDGELRQITEDLFVELARHFEDLSAFETAAYVPEPVVKELPDTAVVVTGPEPERPWLARDGEQITIRKVQQTPAERSRIFWKYAFVNELTLPEFKIQYEKGLDTWREEQERQQYYESREGSREWRNMLEEEEKQGKSLGIDKVVIVNPFYLSLDERKGGSVQYLRAEERQLYFRNTLKELSGRTKVNTTLLDVSALTKNEVEAFNDIIALDQYFDQQVDHYALTLTPAYHQNEIDRIADKYGTSYFLWTGVIALQEKQKVQNLYMLSLLLPPVLPAAIVKSFTPKIDMLYYAILFDVKTGKRSVIKMDYFNKRDLKSLLRAHIYDVFHQIGKR